MNRRALLSAFTATAGGILMPEPRRAYSFLWERETEYKRVIRLAAASMREFLDKNVCIDREMLKSNIERCLRENWDAVVVPPGVTVETISTPGELVRDRTLRMRVTVQLINWNHAARLLSEGFEFA